MKPHTAKRPAGPRRAAEGRPKAKPATMQPQTKADLLRLQHEVEVRQIELEIQNEELRTAHTEITSGLERYIDLYDLAPVGYFNLTADGTIRLVNFTGARLLNCERARLLRRPFGSFMAETDRRAFDDCLARCFATGTKQTCEIALEPAGQPPLAGLLVLTRAPDDQECRVVLVDITGDKQAVAALEKSRNLLTQFERIGKVGGWEFNIDTQKQIWTEEVYHIHEVELAYEPTVAKGVAFYTPASRPIIERAVQRAIEAGEPFDVELEIITAKGNRRCIRAIGHADREHRRVFGFFQDLTRQKLAKEALHESEERYRLLVEESPDGIGVYQEGKLVFVNLAGARQLGAKSKNEILGRRLEQIVHPDDQAAALDRVRRRLAGETGVYPAEVRYVRLDGGVVPMEVGAVPIRYRGEPAVQFVVRDITERKQAEVALRTSERFSKSVLDSLTAQIAVLDEHGTIVAVNEAWKRFARKHGEGDPPDYVGTNYFLVSQEIVQRGQEQLLDVAFLGLLAVMRGEQAEFSLEYPRHSAGEPEWFNLRATRFPGEGPIRVVVAHDDITVRKNSEAHLKTLNDQLRMLAARLNQTREEERASLAREMHDVVAQEMIRLKMDLSKMQRHLARSENEFARQHLLEGLAAAISLADKSLCSVQQIATELRPAVLESLGLCASMQWQANEFTNRTRVPCQVSVPTKNLHLNDDVSTALFRIVQEALTNVERHARASRVDISLRREGKQLRLAIQDNGCGMAPKKFTDSTSIGILGMQERALLLGTKLDIVSQPGRGTTVKVNLRLTLESLKRK